MSLCLVLIQPDYQPVTCGVPQGSVLGPLLFLLRRNDLPKCSNILEFHLIADDTNLFLNKPYILNLENNLSVELDKVSQWLYANNLSLTIEKKTACGISFSVKEEKLIIKFNLQYVCEI